MSDDDSPPPQRPQKLQVVIGMTGITLLCLFAGYFAFSISCIIGISSDAPKHEETESMLIVSVLIGWGVFFLSLYLFFRRKFHSAIRRDRLFYLREAKKAQEIDRAETKDDLPR